MITFSFSFLTLPQIFVVIITVVTGLLINIFSLFFPGFILGVEKRGKKGGGGGRGVRICLWMFN